MVMPSSKIAKTLCMLGNFATFLLSAGYYVSPNRREGVGWLLFCASSCEPVDGF